MKHILRLGLLSILLAAGPALARQAQLVDVPFRDLQAATGTPLTTKQVESAIRDGARTNRWNVMSSEPGKMVLRLGVRSHQVDVSVKYDQHGFDIDYLDCVNLNYETKRGFQYIHPNYNVWVGRLADAIANSSVIDPTRVPVATAADATTAQP
jgi:hypothetical protein